MAYESFYGGRQGISFVIVARYKTIDEMLADFRQGGITTNKINYGEYVIIDTINKNSLENGCIYRRGMNYSDTQTKPPYPQPGQPTDDYKAWMENPGAGAEYIGQVRGPEGTIKELQVGEYKDDVLTKGEYTPSDMASGKEENNIKYSWVNVTNEIGDIVNYLIGFRFPYLVQEFEGTATDPYDRTDLVTDITGAELSERPFYRKWEIRVPQGVKGNTVGTVAVFPTYVRAGSTVYNQVNEETGALFDVWQASIEEDLKIDVEDYWLTKDKDYVKFKYLENGYKYASLKDCYCWHIGFTIIDYSESAEGTVAWVDGGEYHVIDSAYVDTEGNEGQEGYGDQQIHIIQGDGTDEPLGKPINYIVESTVTKALTDSEGHLIPMGIEEGHLLIWQSDPVRRQTIPTARKVSYPNKYGVTLTDWEDMGFVKSRASGGFPIIGEVASLNDLKNDQGQWVPPEILFGQDYKGQCVTIKEGVGEDQNQSVYAYDYNTTSHGWYFVGKAATASFSADGIFVISETEPSTLGTNGIQGFAQKMTWYD